MYTHTEGGNGDMGDMGIWVEAQSDRQLREKSPELGGILSQHKTQPRTDSPDKKSVGLGSVLDRQFGDPRR